MGARTVTETLVAHEIKLTPELLARLEELDLDNPLEVAAHMIELGLDLMRERQDIREVVDPPEVKPKKRRPPRRSFSAFSGPRTRHARAGTSETSVGDRKKCVVCSRRNLKKPAKTRFVGVCPTCRSEGSTNGWCGCGNALCRSGLCRPRRAVQKAMHLAALRSRK